jgi:prepilin-type N-terminal cleavage/methylation domain-containing protein
MKQISKQSGFTLIELLVVIVILGILSTISVGTFRSYFAKARDSERVSAVQSVAMMIKVDSGGNGDCSVYNYTGKQDDGSTNCDESVVGFSDLLVENDYLMPEAKNELEYYYGVLTGAVEGDNDFFIVVGAEEAIPQNGKKIGTTSAYVFVDGTTDGIDAITSGDCVWTDNVLTACTAVDPSWRIFPISGCSAMNCGGCSDTECVSAGCHLDLDSATGLFVCSTLIN